MNEKEMKQFAEFAKMYAAFKSVHGEDGVNNVLMPSVFKTLTGTNTAPLLFGNTGLFTTQGLESDIITAYVRPQGIMGEIDSYDSILEHPVFGTITGVQDNGAAAVDNPCDDAPSGYLKGCNITAQFGRLQFDTQEMEFDKIFMQLNSGVNTELRLHGRLLGLGDDMSNLTESDVLNIVIGAEMVKVGMLMDRGTTNQLGLVQQVWQGVIGNNSAGGGYKNFPGLDVQITTGHVDFSTGTTCPAIDSDVKDFNYQLISAVNANNVPLIAWYLSTLEFYLKHNAMRMGLDPVEWVVTMRPELWDELTQYWPIAYNTNRGAELLAAATNVQLNLDASVMTAARDKMRDTKTIAINGRMYRVVTDDGIFEHTNINNGNVAAGQYASSIYMVPLTINGGFPVTYFEHIDYRRGMTLAGVNRLMGKENFWTDRGMYSWSIENQKWCFKLSAKTERRIVLRTPQLAGRIDHVLYEPLQHLRSSFPNDPYLQNGGVSTRPATTVNAVWA
jgi:hypothetical protein